MTDRMITYKNFLMVLLTLLFLITQSAVIYSQITIGSLDKPENSAVLELKSDNDDKGFLGPRVELKSIYDMSTIKNPANSLIVYNTKDSDPAEVYIESERVRAHRFYYWTGQKWIEIVGKKYARENVERAFANIGIPRPALYILNGTEGIFHTYYQDMKGIRNFMQSVGNNTSKLVPMKETVNYTNNAVKFDQSLSRITLEPGIYSITFSYEFIPIYSTTKIVNCTYSAYYMDFPNNRISNGSVVQETVRVYSASMHNDDIVSDHGGSFNYVAHIFVTTNWEVKLGRTTCSCTFSPGFSMPNRSTFLYISRLGDSL